MDASQQNYMRGVNGQSTYLPNTGFMGNDLTNLATDLQAAPAYELEKQVRYLIL